MRAAAVCFASSLAAIASAVAVLAPEDQDEREAAAPPALAVPSDRAALAAPGLPPVCASIAPPRAVQRAESSPIADSVVSEPRDATEELERLRAALIEVQARLADSERRVVQLVQDHCQERFDVELDRWLDGPLGWLHEDDVTLRERLRDALVACAEEHLRSRVWDPDLREWLPGECPEEVDRLRERIPDALVIRLADLFTGWERDQRSRPQVEMSWGCGVSPRVEVKLDGRKSSYLREDAYVQFLLAEEERVDREWKGRINALLDAPVFDLE